MAGHRAPCTRQVLWGHWARCWGALSPAPQLLLMRAIPSLEWRKSTFLQFVFVTAASLCAQLAVLEFSVLSPQLSLLRSSAEEYGCDERLKASAAALTHSIPSHLLNPASCRGDTPHTTRTGTQRSGQDRVFGLRRSTHSSYPVPRGRALLYPGTQGRGRPAGWEAARKAPEQPVVTGLGGSKQVRYIACRQRIPRGFSPPQNAHSCADARRLCSLRRAKGSTSCSRPKQRSFT